MYHIVIAFLTPGENSRIREKMCFFDEITLK